MRNGKQPITPTMYTKIGDGENDYLPLKDGQTTGWEVKFGGLTKREYFAVLAMQGLISYGSWDKNTSRIAVELADRLLNELDK